MARVTTAAVQWCSCWASSQAISPQFSPVRGMIAQEFVFTRDFLIERNSRVYFRVKKIPCGNKDQARARVAGEKCGLEQPIKPNA